MCHRPETLDGVDSLTLLTVRWAGATPGQLSDTAKGSLFSVLLTFARRGRILSAFALVCPRVGSSDGLAT